ncbi:hypothetical protein FNF29_05308 [Cafeteria roenbergensis]|uniref:J domain-containing protein n=2 Tax=Cafeteria roenbergensis TaxID=33653 RepID=A0A5A8CBJ3_CAFRO|nr:hypothetical protein FNF29_05308 [Cafeteria roenbergensis]|eukprot:KAA0150295.1 hypothetical protein FNF29_05308 [Cafeteria roenbergensis]
MQIAGEFELERKKERQDLERANAEAEARVQDLEDRNDELTARLEAAEAAAREAKEEAARLAAGGDDATKKALRESVAARFALTDALRMLSGVAVAASPSGALDILGAATAGKHAGAGHASACKVLLTEGADPGAVEEGGGLRRSALHAAAAGGHEAACKALLRQAQTQAAAQAQAAAERAQAAAEADDAPARARATQELGLARGALGRLLDARDTTGCTALALAARAGHAGVCKLLLLQGSDPSVADEDDVVPETAAEEADAAAALGVLRDGSILFWNASVRANRLYSERRYNEAIGAYSTALELAAEHGLRASRRDLATLHYNRARAAFRLGRHVAAVEDCGAALEQDESYRNALAQRAECHMSLFDFERAARDFRALLDADPSDRQWARRLLEAERMRDLSHYAVLGLPATFSGSQLKRAYRTACLRWHPDKHAGTPEAGHRAHVVFRRVAQANEALQDSYQRMMHDMELRARGVQPAADSGHGFDAWFKREAARDAEREEERRSAEEAAAACRADEDKARARARELMRKLAGGGAAANAGAGAQSAAAAGTEVPVPPSAGSGPRSGSAGVVAPSPSRTGSAMPPPPFPSPVPRPDMRRAARTASARAATEGAAAGYGSDSDETSSGTGSLGADEDDEDVLGGRVGGFVDQLDQLDEQIKALMANEGGAAGAFVGAFDDATDDDDDDGDHDDHGDHDGRFARHVRADDDEFLMRQAYRFGATADRGEVFADVDDDLAWAEAHQRQRAAFGLPRHTPAGASSRFSPRPEATPRTEQAARRAADAAFQGTEQM